MFGIPFKKIVAGLMFRCSKEIFGEFDIIKPIFGVSFEGLSGLFAEGDSPVAGSDNNLNIFGLKNLSSESSVSELPSTL